MQVLRLAELSEGKFHRLLGRAQSDISEVLPRVSEIVRRVQENGDSALVQLVNELEFSATCIEDLRVSEAEITTAAEKIPAELRAALDLCFYQIHKFHERQRPEELTLSDLGEGILAGEKITALSSVGLYVPRGKGSFPSVALMLGIPALVAGVKRIVISTPADRAGNVDPACLYAANLCGIKEIYRMGGAHAIAGLGLGTPTISPVVKIIGPGGIYATAAKRLLYGQVDVGLPAGPSEAVIIADEHADPRLVAVDMLIEAEHGPDSASLVVTHSEDLCRSIMAEVSDFLPRVPEWRRSFIEISLENYGGILLTPSLESSIRFANDYAPEHLQLHVRDPFAVLNRITTAGEVLLGSTTPISLANYAIGVNAILPTGRFARSFSPVSVRDFMKSIGVAHVTPSAFQRLADAAIILADYEGFPAHAMALRERLDRQK